MQIRSSFNVVKLRIYVLGEITFYVNVMSKERLFVFNLAHFQGHENIKICVCPRLGHVYCVQNGQ